MVGEDLLPCPFGRVLDQFANGRGLGAPPLLRDGCDLDGAGESRAAQPVEDLIDLPRGKLDPLGSAGGEKQLLLVELEQQHLEQFTLAPQLYR